jgi:hypothetical protein
MHCNQCQQETNHAVLFAHQISYDEAVDDERQIGVYGSDTYSLIQCRGCDDVRGLREHWFSEDTDADGDPIIYTECYPPNVTRPLPDWHWSLSHPLRSLLKEVYLALGTNALSLATMGIRALVEKMMIDNVGDKGRFEKNIDAFFAAGFIAPIQHKTFKDTLIEAGHAAMHRDWAPSMDDVIVLLDIVEPLLRAIYIEPDTATKVAARIPPRPRRGGS